MPVNKHRYLFLIGFLIIFSFVVIGLLISKRLDRSVNEFSGAVTNIQNRQKSYFYTTQFNEPLKSVSTSAGLLAGVQTIQQAEDLIPQLRTILFSDLKIDRIWFVSFSAKDTSFQSFQRETYNPVSLIRESAYLKSWAFAHLRNKNRLKDPDHTELIRTKTSAHWLSGRKVNLPDSSVLFFGFDINLNSLHKRLSEIDPLGQSYALVTDQSGFCIFHPDERMIGKRVVPPARFPVVVRTLEKKGALADTLNSGFLRLPVVRHYTFLNVGTQRWILTVDTPIILFDQEVKAVTNYTVSIGFGCVILVIAVVLLAQRTWQKEFTLRQQAEDLQSELLFEKQQLQITTEKQQKENALLQLGKLKEKINPHFLFNSLVSLNGLISQDAGMAKEFVVKLSKVYRYVLNEFPDSLSSAEEEIRFAEQYNFLLKIRFGDALLPLQVKLHDMPENGKLPFMSLQTAVENAVKHNVLSKSQPLGISIEFENDCLIVSNNLQLRKDMNDSSGHGLAYIESIYRHYGNERFRHGAEGEIYRCYLPLL